MTSTDQMPNLADRDSPIPFTRLVHVELRKLLDTRASRWLLAAIVAITPVVIAVMLVVAEPHNLTYNKLVDYTQTPQKILLPALGILAMTSEWTQRTGLVTFTFVPGRRRVLSAKFVAVTGLGIVVIVIAFATAAFGNVLGIALAHGDGGWNFGAAAVGEIVLVQLTGLMQGMAFGMTLLSGAAALAAYYVIPNLWTVLFRSTPTLQNAAPWLDLNKAQTPLYTHTMTSPDWIHLLIAGTLWILLPLLLGLIRVSRAEVRSA